MVSSNGILLPLEQSFITTMLNTIKATTKRYRKNFDLYGWISLMSQLIIINRALYVNKQQEGKICAIT